MNNLFDFSQGTDKVYAFIDENCSAIMVKVASGEGLVDPVEMLPEEVREFAKALVGLADLLDKPEADGAPKFPKNSG